MNCRHCEDRIADRPRGLCSICYYNPDVRQQYPSSAKPTFGDFEGFVPMPPSPTSAPPGSPQKVKVLMQRARRNQQLWHPRDAWC